MGNTNLVPYETIVRATSGEPEAVEEVLLKDFLINFTKNSQLGQKNRARNLYLRFLAL